MKFKYQEIDVEIGRTVQSKGTGGCLWTNHLREKLAEAIRERRPARIEFDGQEVQARRNPRMDSYRWMRFLLDGELFRVRHLPQ